MGRAGVWLKLETSLGPATLMCPASENSNWAWECEQKNYNLGAQLWDRTADKGSIHYQWPKHQGFPVLPLLVIVEIALAPYSKGIRGAQKKRFYWSWLFSLRATETQINKCKTEIHWLRKLQSPEVELTLVTAGAKIPNRIKSCSPCLHVLLCLFPCCNCS